MHQLRLSTARRRKSKYKRMAIIVIVIINPSIIHAHTAAAESLAQQTRGVLLPTEPTLLTVSPGLIEFWLRLRLGGSSFGKRRQTCFLPINGNIWKHNQRRCPGPSRSQQEGHGGPSGASVASLLPRCYCENTSHTRCWWWKKKKRTIRQIKYKKSILRCIFDLLTYTWSLCTAKRYAVYMFSGTLTLC